MKRDFKGVWIPKEIWLNEDLSITERCLLVEIDSLDFTKSGGQGCFKGNEALGVFLNLSAKRVQAMITKLKKMGYLELIGFDGTKRFLRCLRSEVAGASDPRWQGPQIRGHSNTVSNTVSKSTPSVVFSPEILECYHQCAEHFPNHLIPHLPSTWLDTISKLQRIDKIPLPEIVRIVALTRNDDFWSKNFLSLVKLRKKNRDGIPYIVVFNENFKNNKDHDRQAIAALAESLR